MEASASDWRLVDPVASCSRSRMTSDFEILRPRDSASISATSGSGKRTVNVFTRPSVLRRCQARNTIAELRAFVSRLLNCRVRAGGSPMPG